MNRGIYPILSGALAQERQVQVFANNVANVNTAGFKQDEPLFRALLAQSSTPASSAERIFVSAQGLKTVFDSGRLRHTGNPFDLAIRGSGWFEVKTPHGLRYTRNGVFHLDGKRRLVNELGYPVMGRRGEISFKKEGEIRINPAGSISINNEEVAGLKVVEFPDERRPVKAEDGLFAGQKPKLSKEAVVEVGYVEESNVNAVTEMVKLIQGMRMYESAQKVMQTFDRMTERAIEDLGKVG